MKLYDQYLGEAYFKNEFPDVRAFREKSGHIWLYHGTPRKNLPLIRKGGLDPTKSVGHWMVKKLRGKQVTSFTSIKEYALFYASRKGLAAILKKQMGEVLLVRLSTNPNHLTYGTGGTGMDEYDYVLNVPPKDILFPDDPKYKQVEKKCKYLRNNYR